MECLWPGTWLSCLYGSAHAMPPTPILTYAAIVMATFTIAWALLVIYLILVAYRQP